MEEPIFNPTIPYIGPIYGGKFVPGKMVKIQGTVPTNANRFNIHLQCGSRAAPRDDVAIRVSVRFAEGHISLNSLENTTWGREQRDVALPVKRGEKFKMILICDASQYMVAINGQHCYEFPQRIPYSRITHLAIDGDIVITQISYDLPSESGSEAIPKAATSTSSSPAKTKRHKPKKKNSITKKTFSAQVHAAPLPEMDSGVPRRLSYEAAIYGTEAAYGYQEVSIIPSGTSSRTNGSCGPTTMHSGLSSSSYRPSPPSVGPSVLPYPINGPKGMPFPKRPTTPTNGKVVLSASPPRATNGAGTMPQKSIKRPMDPPPAAPKASTPPTTVTIPVTTASPNPPIKNTDSQMRWSNFFGIVVGGLFVLFFIYVCTSVETGKVK